LGAGGKPANQAEDLSQNRHETVTPTRQELDTVSVGVTESLQGCDVIKPIIVAIRPISHLDSAHA
jgi:hypothetical protein